MHHWLGFQLVLYSSGMWASAKLMLGAGLMAVACHAHEEVPDGAPPPAAPASPDSIPEGPLAGTLRGSEFTHQAATYVVDRRLGYEHFDIRLAAQPTDKPCERGAGAGGTSVWIRRRGVDAVTAATVRLTPGGQSDWEVHYQVDEHDRWEGNANASALVVVAHPGPDLSLRGELWACFADGRDSCVSGAFKARYCPISIDAPIRGTQLMERPTPAATAAASAVAAPPTASAAPSSSSRTPDPPPSDREVP
jgi:hypothetical protein